MSLATASGTAAHLLESLGISDSIAELSPLTAGLTNTSWKVATGGKKYVLRQYPSPEIDSLDRLRKEPYLHRLLDEAGVPVAKILASSPDNDGAVLLEFIEGELLGEVSSRLSNEDRERAWATSGEALRKAHTIEIPDATHGVIEGDSVSPVCDSWGEWQMENVLDHARSLHEDRVYAINLDLLKDV